MKIRFKKNYKFMVIQKELGSVASWNANLTSEPADKTLVGYSKFLLMRSFDVIEILKQEDLFILNKLILKRWSYWDNKKKKYANMRLSESILRGEEIDSEEALNFIDSEIARKTKAVPFEFEFFGKGIIYGEDNDQLIHENVIWLNSVIFIELYVSIHTQSYAWLPYDLQGLPQKDIFKKNAPRLSRALRGISNLAEIDLSVFDEQTQFAMVDKYAISNILNAQGKPIKTKI